MYPGFAKTARDEGLAELAEWFETLAKAEKSHAGRFTRGLEKVAGKEPAEAAGEAPTLLKPSGEPFSAPVVSR
jgi:rubrerythrin